MAEVHVIFEDIPHLPLLPAHSPCNLPLPVPRMTSWSSTAAKLYSIPYSPHQVEHCVLETVGRGLTFCFWGHTVWGTTTGLRITAWQALALQFPPTAQRCLNFTDRYNSSSPFFTSKVMLPSCADRWVGWCKPTILSRCCLSGYWVLFP